MAKKHGHSPYLNQMLCPKIEAKILSLIIHILFVYLYLNCVL